jgi:tetratricopeptide (TPR) repeat protein
VAINKAKAIEAAQKLVSANKLKEAVAEYQKIHKEEPKDQNVLNALGDLYARMNSIPDALTYYTKLADIYVGDGFLVRGIAMYKKISKLDAANTTAMERLADLYTMQGLMTDARAQYLALAEACLKTNATNKAMEVMAKVLDLDPSNVKIQQRLADLYEHHGQAPQAAQIYGRLAEHALQADQVGEALKWVQKATHLAPSDAGILLLEAQLHQRTGKAEAALATLEKIPNLEEHPEALHLLLKAKLDSGDAAAAETLAEKLFSADSKNFAAFLEIAKHAAEKKDGERAWKVLGRIAEPALAHDPGQLAPVARRVASLLADSAEAAELAVQATRKAGDQSGLLEALGRRAHQAEQAEDFARAKEAYDELVTLQPENPDFAAKLRSMREKLGEPAVAAEAHEAAPTMVEHGEAAPAEVELDEETQAYVNASMTDIDLFSSYGMTDKAIELAEQVVSRVPSHLGANEKLLDFYLGTGNDQKVVQVARRLEKLARKAGNAGRAEEVGEIARRYAEKAGKEAPAEAAAVAAPAEAVHEVDLSAEWATATEAPAEVVEAPAVPLFNAKEAGEEIDFYLTQNLTDQALAAIARYEEQFPGEAAVAELRARVEAAAAPAEAPPAEAPVAEAAPVEAAPEEAPAGVAAGEGEGQTFEISLEPQPAAPAPAAGPMSAGDFFADLAGELDQALAGAGAPPAPTKAPAKAAPPARAAAPPPGKAPAEAPAGALAEVFEEFKEELGEVEEVEDPETHYNLGIAYKEMGLMEEAISEFQKVVKAAEKTGSSSHLFQVCTLLGVCFIEKGLPAIAVKWYERALKSPGLDEEGALALRYDMGVAHEQAGNRKAALDCFMEVYGANVDYRNVGERIRELQGAS